MNVVLQKIIKTNFGSFIVDLLNNVNDNHNENLNYL